LINAVDDKIRALDIKEQKTVLNISIIVEKMNVITTNVEGLMKSQPDDFGEWIEKRIKTDSEVKGLTDKVEDIEEEYSNKFEDQEQYINKLDDKIIHLESKLQNILNKMEESPIKNVSPNAMKSNCEICQKTFKSFENLQAHDNKFHIKVNAVNTAMYTCNYCSSTFEEKSELSVHMTERHTIFTYCRKLFPNPKVLETHIQAIHKKRKHEAYN
jgi:hypothetical protein